MASFPKEFFYSSRQTKAEGKKTKPLKLDNHKAFEGKYHGILKFDISFVIYNGDRCVGLIHKA